MLKPAEDQLCPGSPVKAGGIPSICTDSFLHTTVGVPTFILRLDSLNTCIQRDHETVYRLNEIKFYNHPDRMNDLLQAAKAIPFTSTIEMKACYHQDAGSDEYPIEYSSFLKQNATLRQQKERLSLLSELLSEEPQLVVPEHGSTLIVQKHHDAQKCAGHYEAEETFNRMSNRYYWTGMRKFITEEQRWIFLIEDVEKMG
ncbi:hypothetical protein CEXT_618941 [Caerostris extrusa]|uniref:Integrase zinc-binding domain-containing protein n=1 Tax=Caerostris extrusa TaxID=172846 RepID=A0AAV4T2E7_CAEEX|nr:hypothetical protein CEXT_618941 [Caerostris extrusa]